MVQGELEEKIVYYVKRLLGEKKVVGELKSLLNPMKSKVIKLKAKVEKKDVEIRNMRVINIKKDNVDVNFLKDHLALMVDQLEVERKNVELKNLKIEQIGVKNHELLDNLQKSKDCTDKEITLNKMLNQQLKLKGEEEFKIKEELSKAKNKIQGLESDLLKTKVQVVEFKQAIAKVHELPITIGQRKAEEKCRVKSKEFQDLHRQLADERLQANQVLSNLIGSNAKLDIEQTRIKEFQILIKQYIKDRLTRFSLESIVKDSKISELVKHREAQQNTSLRELSDEVEAVNM